MLSDVFGASLVLSQTLDEIIVHSPDPQVYGFTTIRFSRDTLNQVYADWISIYSSVEEGSISGVEV